MDQDDPQGWRPELTLMPEHSVDVPVWRGPGSEGSGHVSAEELTALGVSLPLIERLRAWGESWDHDPATSSPRRESWPGSSSTVRLARHLQSELPGHRILLDAGDGPRPVEEWAD